jgi:hypothetical protein
MSFQLSPHVRLTPCVRTRGSLQFRHRALSSAHGAKHGSDSQHGGGGNDSTIVVIGPQARGDKGCLVSVSLGAPPCGSTTNPPSYPWPFGLKLRLTVIWERTLCVSVNTKVHPTHPQPFCHEVGGGFPSEEFLIIVLFIFFGHRPTTPGCRAKVTHCWPAPAPSGRMTPC